MVNFKCKHCGKCCQNIYTHEAMFMDIERWLKENREDILSQLLWVKAEDGIAVRAFMWKDHDTGRELKGDCPFLKKKVNQYLCEIQDTKPTVCKNKIFTRTEAKRFGCKGYEKGD